MHLSINSCKEATVRRLVEADARTPTLDGSYPMQLKAPMLAAVVAFAAVSTPAHASLPVSYTH
ncbi:MAG: hypothetical protein N2439_06720, partial [Anaerolineae bacterium]|nr:hypothetical protein [Anaerolineae bacterium]